MDLKQDFLQNYQKEYKKTNRVIFVMLALVICIPVSINKQYGTIITILICIVEMLLALYIDYRYCNNINKLIYKWKNDLDTEFALDIFSQLLKDKNRLDYPWILFDYLNLLVNTCRFDEFEKVYEMNRRIFKKSPMRLYLKRLKELFLPLKEERDEYKSMLFKQKFTKFHLAKEGLSERKIRLRFKDKSYEIYQLYEMGEFQKVIEKIEQMHLYNKYEYLHFHSIKERCLYKLKRDGSLPENMYFEILCVRKWKTLVETGKEYTYERANEILSMIKEDLKSCYRKIKIAVFFLVLSLIIIFWGDLKVSMERQYISDIEKWNFEVGDIYGLCKNNDITAAVIYGKLADTDNAETYYLAAINYYMDGIVPKMKLNTKQMFYLGGTVVYTSEGDKSTYIVVAVDEPSKIIYDGKVVQETIVDKMPKSPLFTEPYIYSFIIEGVYDENMLDVQSIK